MTMQIQVSLFLFFFFPQPSIVDEEAIKMPATIAKSTATKGEQRVTEATHLIPTESTRN